MLVEDVGHFGELVQVPPGPVELVGTAVPEVDVDGVVFLYFTSNNSLNNNLVAPVEVEVGTIECVVVAGVICTIGQGHVSQQVHEVHSLRLNLRQRELMDRLLEFVAIALADEERRYFDRFAFAIVTHVNMLLCIIVDDDRHHATELLNVLDFLDKMAIAAVDHNDVLMAIGCGFLEMRAIKLALVEFLAAVLVQDWVVDAALEHTLLVVGAEAAERRVNQSLVRGRVELKRPGELVRMQN
jgi:hypothetical protein